MSSQLRSVAKRGTRAMLLVGAVGPVLLFALARPASAQLLGPTVTLSTTSAIPGATVTATGGNTLLCGTEPGTGARLVQLVWYRSSAEAFAPHVLALVPADATGAFSAEFRVPADALPRSYTVEARCLRLALPLGSLGVGLSLGTMVPFRVVPPTTAVTTASATVLTTVVPGGPGTVSTPVVVPNRPPLRSTTTTMAGGSSTTPDPAGLAPPAVPSQSVNDVQRPVPAESEDGRLPFLRTVPTFDDLRTDLDTIATSLAVSGVLVLLVGFPAELFNKTWEENYDEVRSWLRAGDWGLRRRLPAAARFAVFAVAGAVLYGLLDPSLGINVETAAFLAGLLIAIVVTTLALEFPIGLYTSRAGQERTRFRTFPGALTVAAGLVALSRLAHFQPGYIYGIFGGYEVDERSVSRRDEGKGVALGVACLAAVTFLAGLSWAPTHHVDANSSFGLLLLESVLKATFVTGVESLAFGLIPLRFLDGYKLAGWNRGVWAIAHLAAMFGFVYVLLSPATERVDAAQPAPLLAMLALFVTFGTLSVLFWGYFRFRRHRPVGAPAWSAPSVDSELARSWRAMAP